MADLVSPLLGVIFDKLSSPLLGEFGSLWGVQKDLEKLSETSSTVRLVLQDAELKQIHHAATADWLRKLKEAAYEADDVIDECTAEALLSADSGSCSTQVCHSFSICFDFKRLKLRHKIANRIKAVREKFDEIAEERGKFHLRTEEVIQSAAEVSYEYRETSSTLCEPLVYGRDEDQKKIRDLLLSNASSQNEVFVCAIVGMGGIEKTTLAQLIYNDMSIVDAFDTKIWVCISEDFNVKRVTKLIIESLSGNVCQLENLDPLQNHLKDLLSGKRFILVLDDVWNEDQDKWDRLIFPLKCGAKGSSIMITTRQSSVALIMGAHHSYSLKPLADEECWSLFKWRAFGGEDIESTELEVIGKEIVKKCGGVPLAAKALGGSLRMERGVNAWIFVRDSEIWALPHDNEGGILPSLRLSYNHLPSRLKQCFAYCSIFPKDHKIHIEELIQLWMANGLVESQGGMELADVGHQIFNQLLLRSFLQDVEETRRNDTCKMHDLMHDLACSVAGNECLAFHGGGELANIPKSIRHLSISHDFDSVLRSKALKTICNSHPFLRTFLIPPRPLEDGYDMVFKNLKCIRALDLSHSKITDLPLSIGRMKHLRYLNLSNSGLIRLPASLCDLKTLQTLILRWCQKLEMLPARMSNLVNLIHLDLCGCYSFEMPPQMGALVHLRTLGRFIVGRGSGKSIKELHKLNHLEGELVIRGLEHVKDAAEAKEANLTAKRNISGLALVWTNSQENDTSEEVLEALQPHDGLRIRLRICGYRGSAFPSWLNNLVHLERIILNNCAKCEELPTLGHLPLLKSLHIVEMPCLKRINKEFYGNSRDTVSFPSLITLQFCEMPNWEEWQAPDDKQMFPRLAKLSLLVCPNLASLPLPISYTVRKLEVYDCEKLTVRSLPCLHPLSLWDGLSSFQNLESLRLGECKLTSIPIISNCDYLKSLIITNCDSLKSLSQSLQHLSSLEELRIDTCSDLEFSSGEFKYLLSLQTLRLWGLPKLTSLPEDIHTLHTLRSLYIRQCDSLKSLSQSLQHLSSLEELRIDTCSELEFSSGEFKYLLSLQTLTLHGLPKLTSLPDLQHLHTLHTINIRSCKNLRVLPQWLQNLTSLHTLELRECHSDLHVGCKKDDGEYWPYISHIPFIMNEQAAF